MGDGQKVRWTGAGGRSSPGLPGTQSSAWQAAFRRPLCAGALLGGSLVFSCLGWSHGPSCLLRAWGGWSPRARESTQTGAALLLAAAAAWPVVPAQIGLESRQAVGQAHLCPAHPALLLCDQAPGAPGGGCAAFAHHAVHSSKGRNAQALLSKSPCQLWPEAGHTSLSLAWERTVLGGGGVRPAELRVPMIWGTLGIWTTLEPRTPPHVGCSGDLAAALVGGEGGWRPGAAPHCLDLSP